MSARSKASSRIWRPKSRKQSLLPAIPSKDALLEELGKALKRVEEKAASIRTTAESAEKTLESQGELGGKLVEVNGKLANSTAALHDLQSHVDQLEDEIADADQNLWDKKLRFRKLQDGPKAKDVMLEDPAQTLRTSARVARKRPRIAGCQGVYHGALNRTLN